LSPLVEVLGASGGVNLALHVKSEDRERKKAWKAEQRAAARARFPLADAELQELFDHVDARLDETDCEHSRRFTEAWLHERQADVATVLAWLDETGGSCDCEVVANSRDEWEQSRRE
jgi:uncharacterized protein YecT (DUF1311 family)